MLEINNRRISFAVNRPENPTPNPFENQIKFSEWIKLKEEYIKIEPNKLTFIFK